MDAIVKAASPFMTFATRLQQMPEKPELKRM
jgi:hypothetical protein